MPEKQQDTAHARPASAAAQPQRVHTCSVRSLPVNVREPRARRRPLMQLVTFRLQPPENDKHQVETWPAHACVPPVVSPGVHTDWTGLAQAPAGGGTASPGGTGTSLQVGAGGRLVMGSTGVQ